MASASLVYALVEDRRQQQFLYRFLVRSGFKPHQVTFELSPSGQGSAEQWVRENFARQVGKCRARNSRGASTVMFVMLDADTRTMRDRLNVLDQALVADNRIPLVRGHDPIARLLPKRNVETWILYLHLKGIATPPVNEREDYKPTQSSEQWTAMIPPAVETLFNWSQSAAELQVGLLDSLRYGIQEIQRVLPAT